jgi:hypothetical protein
MGQIYMSSLPFKWSVFRARTQAGIDALLLQKVEEGLKTSQRLTGFLTAGRRSGPEGHRFQRFRESGRTKK